MSRHTLASDSGIFPVAAYGSVGDGTTNDTAAFQSAIDAAAAVRGTVVFGAKRYRLAGTLTITNRVSLVGAGSGDPDAAQSDSAGTVLIASTDVNAILVKSGAHNTLMRDFAIIGTAGAGSAGSGIVIGEDGTGNGAGGVILRNVIVKGTRAYGVRLASGNHCRLDRVQVEGTGSHGIYLHSPTAFNVNATNLTACTALSCGGDGIRSEIAISTQCFGFTAEGNVGYGLSVYRNSGVYYGHVESNVAGPVYIGPSAYKNHGMITYSTGTPDPSINNTGNRIFLNDIRAGASTTNTEVEMMTGRETGVFVDRRVTLTYGATITPDASVANAAEITPTDSSAFTIANPANAKSGQRLTLRLRNNVGMGTITWGAAYKLAAWTNPASGYSRAITFRYSGSVWVEESRTPADVPN